MPYKDIEKKKACKARYVAAHPEKVRQWALAYQERQKELTRLNHANPEYIQKKADKKKATYRRATLRDSCWTPEQYEAAFASQAGLCAICGDPPEVTKGNPYGRLFGDHSHTTGLPRALLCHACNAAIGMLKERPDLFLACIAYLEKYA